LGGVSLLFQDRPPQSTSSPRSTSHHALLTWHSTAYSTTALYETLTFASILPASFLNLLISNNSVLLVSGPLTMSYSRVKIADIPALTLYNGEPTLSRRGQPFPQLVCKGKPCNLFTPDVIRCVNVGGEGTNVDWKVCSRQHFVAGSLPHGDMQSAKQISPSHCDWAVFRCLAKGGRGQETLTS
jgi:hypothetical protein